MNTVKVTVNLPEDLVERLRDSAKGKTLTEVIRKGLETELFLTNEENSGSKVLLEKKDNKIVQIVRR
jgi:hypothetical protein